MSGLPLPEPVADEDDDGLQDRAALLTPARPRPGRRRPRPRPHTAAGRCLPLVKTLTICLAFFTLGLCIALPGPTLLDLQDQVSVSMAQISQIFFWRALGYLGGSMISGLLFDKLNRLLMMLASMALAAAGMATVPWLSSALSLNVCFAAVGVPLGFVDTGGNVLLLDLWGKSSGPYMQAIHFSFGLGAFAAPLLAVPFISHAPAVNGSATVLLGRNHLHTIQLPADPPEDQADPPSLPVPDLPGHLTNRPEHRQTPEEFINLATRPPAAAVTHHSSVKRAGVEVSRFTKLGMALAGGNVPVRVPRSAARIELGPVLETEREPDGEAATAREVRKSSVGRKGVGLGGETGTPGGGVEGKVGSLNTEPPPGVVTVLTVGGGGGGGDRTEAAVGDGVPAVVEVTVAPSPLAVMENSGIVTAPIDDAVSITSATEAPEPVENAPPTMEVILNEKSPSETRIILPSDATDGADLARAGQNASEETMYVTPSGSLNLTESPPDVTAVSSTLNTSEPTGEPALQHTPKPKPVFTDGNKLEHDQTWARPPLKPALHPAPAAADTHPGAAAGSPTAHPDTAAGSSTWQTNSSAQTDSAEALGDVGEAKTTPASATNIGTNGGGDVAGGGGGEVTEGGQNQNGTVSGSAAQADGATEPGHGADSETASATATTPEGTGDSVPAAKPGGSSDEAPLVTTSPSDEQTVGSKASMDVNHINNGQVVTVASEPRVTSESIPVSKTAHNVPPSDFGPFSTGSGSETTKSPSTERVTSSEPSTPSPTTGSPAGDSAAAAVASSGQAAQPAAGTPEPEVEPDSGPKPAEVKPAPELVTGPEADPAETEEGDWDPEAAVGTEPGLSVPAVPPTAAAAATSPGVPGAAPLPTTSQGAAAAATPPGVPGAAPLPTTSQGAAAAEPGADQTGGPGRSDTEQAALPPVLAPSAAGDSADHAPQPAEAPEASPATVTPASSSDSRSPSPPPPKPHKPGTYDDTSAEDGLLTRLSSAAAVRGVPPLAQLYLLVSCSLLLVALIFLALLVYDPRARRAAPSSDSGAGPSRCYTAALVSLMAVVLCFYVGMEVAMGQLLMSFSVHSKVHLSRAGGAYVTSVFWGLFAAGRGLSVCVAGVLRPAAVLAVDYVLVTAGATVLLAAGSWDRTALLLGGALSGLGMASVFPAALVWLEQHVHVSSRLAAVLVVAGALGEMLLPAGVGALMTSEPRALTYSLAVCTGVCLVTQAVATVVARLGRPAVGPLEGYQLAAQEEEEDMVDLSKYPGSAEEGSRRLLRM